MSELEKRIKEIVKQIEDNAEESIGYEKYAAIREGIENELEQLIQQERVKAQEEVIKTMQNLDEYRDLVKYLAANYEVMKLTNLLDELKQSLEEKGEK